MYNHNPVFCVLFVGGQGCKKHSAKDIYKHMLLSMIHRHIKMINVLLGQCHN